MSLLRVEKLNVRFTTPEGDVHAVRDLGFELHPGEVLGIVGESGCGKTQAMMGLLGLLPPNGRTEGRVVFQGRDWLTLSPRVRNRLRGDRIGTIFQDPMTSLNPYLTVGAQLIEVLQVHRGMSRAAARFRARAMLDAVQIPDAARRLDQYPHEFSGGMRQRVMIAMAMLCEPPLLIADEPTTALDVTVQAQILALLDEVRTRTGTAVVLITHDLGVVAQVCDRVLVMYAGRMMECGPVKDVFADPRHPYTRALLAAVPRLDDAPDTPLHAIAGQPPDLRQSLPGCPFAARCTHRLPRCEQDAPPPVTVAPGHVNVCHLEAP